MVIEADVIPADPVLELKKATMCLYLAVNESIADDVRTKAFAVIEELLRLRRVEAAARHLRSHLYVGGQSYNEAKYDAEQALDKALDG